MLRFSSSAFWSLIQVSPSALAKWSSTKKKKKKYCNYNSMKSNLMECFEKSYQERRSDLLKSHSEFFFNKYNSIKQFVWRSKNFENDTFWQSFKEKECDNWNFDNFFLNKEIFYNWWYSTAIYMANEIHERKLLSSKSAQLFWLIQGKISQILFRQFQFKII